MTGRANSRAAKILQVTDLHLHATVDSRMRGVRTHDTFLAVMDAATRNPDWPPDAIVVTGDIVQDESIAGYQRFREILKKYAIPTLVVPGNHDDPKLVDELLDEAPFQSGGHAQLGSWIVIMLSTFSAGEDAGVLDAAELDELSRCLDSFPDSHALICLHHHPVPMGSRWLDGVALRNSKKLFDVTDKHDNVRAIVCGHVHQAFDTKRNGVRCLATPSTCSQFLPQSEFFALDVLPPGMRWIRLHDSGELDTEVQWLPSER